MIRVFLDSSVLFSACYSATGHSRDLIMMAQREEIQLVSSRYVLEETRRNLQRKSPDYLLFLDFILDNLQIEIVKPTKRQVLSTAEHVKLKDAPIVAAARRAKVNILVSLDKEHLLDNQKVAKLAGAKVLTPREAIQTLRSN